MTGLGTNIVESARSSLAGPRTLLWNGIIPPCPLNGASSEGGSRTSRMLSTQGKQLYMDTG